MLGRNRHLYLALAGLLLWPAAGAASGRDLRPRAPVIKPARMKLEAYHRGDVIKVKFRDGAPVRVRAGTLTDFGTGALEEARDVLELLAEAEWRPLVDIPEGRLEALRQNAQQSLDREIADFRAWFHVFLPGGLDAAEAIDAFNAMDCVELAEPVQEAAPLPSPAPFGSMQRYLNSGPVGMGALATWEHHGIKGSTAVPIVDIEFGYDFHQDLPPVGQIGPPGDGATQGDRDHGTAVLGVLGALHNGWGSSGVAPSASISFAAARVGGIVNIPQAIVNATDGTGVAGAIILIEQQLAGPASCGNPGQPLGLPPCDCSAGTAWVPVEWDLATYNAILYAVGNGKTVIEPAGNGAQDLDAAIYSTGNNGHWPFLPQNDSGAIIVGAGRGWDFIDVIGSRVCCSNYGSRVDVSGYGTAVCTTGYGDMYSAEGPSLYYTNSFAGTSSASACVAGVAALVQTAYWAANSGPQGPVWMSPAALRQVLKDSGSPQQSAVIYPLPSTQNIGPMPDASIAILMAVGDCVPLYDTAIGNPGMNSWVNDLISFDDGNGAKLYAGGNFSTAGGSSAPYVAAWNGTSWSAVGSGPGFLVHDLEVFNDGGGPRLCAAGGPYGPGAGVARWNGTTWTALGGSFDNAVMGLQAFNGSLYAGGYFTDAGGTSASHVARWNGSSWSAVGGGVDSTVHDLAIYNDGTGVALYAAGEFMNAGGNPAAGVAKWDGSSWSALGSGLWSPPLFYAVYSLEVFHDGSALELYAGGGFFAGPIRNIARWNGSQWSPLGGAANGTFDAVRTMVTFDDGTGNALFLGGDFEGAEDVWANHVAKWDGSRYWALADGVSGGVSALAAHDDGNGPALYVAGTFAAAYDLPSFNVARYDTCPPLACTGDIDGDGTVGITDFLGLLAAWGPNPGHPADIDGDGSVGVTDFLALLGNWGPCP